jgi:hypothetical protein
MIFYEELGDIDITSVSTVLGLQNGWFVAIVGMIFVSYLLLRGHIVSRRTMDSQIKVLSDSLDDERDARKLWQQATTEMLKTNDIDRENSRHMLMVAETTLKIVTDLQAARENVNSDGG